MPFNIGPGELIIVLIIALIVVGPGKLPDVGAALGKSIREFRKAASDVKESTALETTAAATPAPAPAPMTAASVPAPAPMAAPTVPSPEPASSQAAPAEPVAAGVTTDADKPPSA